MIRILRSTRSSLWWNHMVLPWSFWVYLAGFQEKDLARSAFLIIGLIAALSSACILGYFINDYFDRAADELAGKPNFFRQKGRYSVLVLPLAALIEACLWYFLPVRPVTVLLIGSQIILLLLYSVPPVRLKVRSSGILADATYTRVLSVLIILSVSAVWGRGILYVLSVSTLWMFLVGLRNILAHQMDDLDNDRQAGLSTLALRLGRENTQRIIVRFILPLELLTGMVSLVLLSKYVPLIHLAYPVFLIFLMVRFNLWRKASWSKMDCRSHLQYLPNDLYDYFLPVIILLILGIQSHWILLAIPVHFLLFPRAFLKFAEDVPIAIRNTVTYFGFLWLHFRLTCGHIVNWSIYRGFLLFGINLKQENLSAMGYLKKRLGI